MPACDTLSQTAVSVLEGQSGALIMTLRDEVGELVETAALTGISLDLYYWANHVGTVINDRDHQDVMNLNGGTFYDDLQSLTDTDGNVLTYNYRWNYEPDDTPFLRDPADTAGHQTEVHVAHFRFTWDSGTKAIAHEVKMTVTNFRRFPETSP